MYLAKLEIHGFKSFAHKTVFEFPRGLTAIVGPNGSGKSNVADAVRWALGEQSLKVLRGKKSEDVIFAGSDKRTRLGMADVSIWLDNSDRRAPIDHSEIVLTRRVYRLGEGEYFVNKRPARLHDILLLLAQANFGQRTYSVIGQGMVESFLTSSPEQRKELFEDAAGVRQYQMKREQSFHKLSQTRENIGRVELLLQEISPRLRSLTRQVRRLERRSDVEHQLREQQVHSYAARLADNATERSQIASQRDEIQASWEQSHTRLAAIQKELEGLEAKRSRAEVFADLQREYTSKIDAKNRFLEEQAVLKGRLELLAAQSGKFDALLFSREARAVLNRLAALEVEAGSLTTALAQLATKLAAFEGQRSKLFDELRRQLDQASLEGTALQRLIRELETLWSDDRRAVREAARLATRHDLVREERERLEQERQRIEREGKSQAAKDPKDAYTVMMAQHESLDQNIRQLDFELTKLRDQLNRFNTREQEKQERLFELQKAFRDEQQTLNLLANRRNEFNVQLAKIDTRREDLERELKAELPSEIQTQIAAAVRDGTIDRTVSLEQRAAEIQKLKHSLELIGGIDEGTEQEYRQTKERHDFLKGQFDDLTRAIRSLEKVIAELDQTIKRLFDAAFEQINQEFGRYFRTLFNGGQAKLILQREVVEEPAEGNGGMGSPGNGTQGPGGTDDHSPIPPTPHSPKLPGTTSKRAVTGIEIQATPPGKKLKSLAMLSGGERALTAIALISAIIASNPSPFVVLDEVDAALDEANSARFAKILAHLAEKTQFITITHNRTTMEHAQVLYGVTMSDDGVSKLLSIKMDDAEKVIASYGNRR